MNKCKVDANEELCKDVVHERAGMLCKDVVHERVRVRAYACAWPCARAHARAHACACA